MHVYGFVALSSQFLLLSLFLYNGVIVVILILIALSGLVLFVLIFPENIYLRGFGISHQHQV